ncbi:MAG: aminodeoxychorismate/anthranilate synthase component II [Elusimicrobia bacterium]|nr:aminodeoxychorismate/anthranilate synthase component II [Elusimicrobiota bacterium]
MRRLDARVLLIDNYDSFTYNLYQALRGLGARVDVVRNDKIDLAGIRRRSPSHLVLSPGPGRPEDAGVTVDAIRGLAGEVPILGVCLGHQAIGLAFGGKVVRARRLMHGKLSQVRHDGRGVYRGLPNPFVATRYHSLTVQERGLPACLERSSRADDGTLMGLRHRRLAVEGVQFHPESVMTPDGVGLLRNFLRTSC